MFCRVALFLAFTATSYSFPHFEYRAIGIRDNTETTVTEPASSGTGASPHNTGNVTNVFNLSSYCSVQFDDYVNTYNPTGQFTTSTITDYEGFYGSGSRSSEVVTQTYSTRTITFTKEGYIAYQQGGAKPPCCNSCHISAGTIEFFWWPDLATSSKGATRPANTTGSPVTAIGSNGFIFTSPSVYMAFSSLYAHNFCGTVGDAWYNTTIPFHPNEISTVNAYQVTFSSYYTTRDNGSTLTVWNTEAGTRKPPSPLQYSDLAQNCSTISGYNYFPNDPQNDIEGGFDHDACHPVLAIPPSLVDMQQVWKDHDCKAIEGYGAYDPPVALTAASEEAKPTLPAQPGGYSTPSSAPATSTYSALPDNEPTTSSSAAPETTYILGGGQSSSGFYSNNAPYIQPTASELDGPSSSDFYSYNSPFIQPTASDLDGPTRTQRASEQSSDVHQPAPTGTPMYTVVQVTTDNGGETTTFTHTTMIGQEPEQTRAVETTETGGAVVTYITTLQPGVVNGPGGQDESPAPAATYTVLQEMTLANGQATVVSTIMALTPGAPIDTSTQTAAPVLIITVAGTAYTADASSNFVIDGQTASAGGSTITIDSTPIAILPDGSSAVVGSSTISLALATPAEVASITLGTSLVTANTAGGYVAAPGTTLSVGGPSVTIENTAYALKTNTAGQTMLIAGAARGTSTTDIGGYIMSAIGATGSKGTSTSTSKSSEHMSAGSSLSSQAAVNSAGPGASVGSSSGTVRMSWDAVMILSFVMMAVAIS